MVSRITTPLLQCNYASRRLFLRPGGIPNSASLIRIANMTSCSPSGETPAQDEQVISKDGKLFKVIQEGLAKILIPYTGDHTGPKSAVNGLKTQNAQRVFYNPVQQFNRDLSVLIIRHYANLHKSTERERSRGRLARGEATQLSANGDTDTPKAVIESKVDCDGEKPPESPEASSTDELGQPVEETDKGETSVTGASNQSESHIGDLNRPEDTRKRTRANEVPDGSADSRLDERVSKRPRNSSYSKPFRILDALSASGLRALRYALEVPGITSVTANDLSSTAVESIKEHVVYNGLSSLIQPSTGNALAHMYAIAHQIPLQISQSSAERPRLLPKYNVIDLDPYGTAVPFLDAAIQSIVDGGLLCITCTDSGVFASNGWPEKTFSLYGGMPMKSHASHEAGLRLILHAVSTSAAKYGVAIEPLVSLSIDFYARVFVRVKKSPASTKFHCTRTMIVYNCDQGCGSWTVQPMARLKAQQAKDGRPVYTYGVQQGPTAPILCEHCGFKTHIGGPMYGGPLHSPHFLASLIPTLDDVSPSTYATLARIKGLLQTAYEESAFQEDETYDTLGESRSEQVVDNPFFVSPQRLAAVLHCQTPSDAQLRGALMHLGYKVTRSHCKPGSLKTDAPWKIVWEIMRQFIKQKSPIKDGVLRPETAGLKIMGNAIEEQVEVVFDEALGKGSIGQKLRRYQINPANWGPMKRAKATAEPKEDSK